MPNSASARRTGPPAKVTFPGSPWLTDAQLHLRTAREHLEAITAVAASHQRVECRLVPTAVEGRVDDWHLIVRLSQPPAGIAATVGEVIHNLRATLDDLVRCFAETGPRRRNRHASFPICSNRREFATLMAADHLDRVGLKAQMTLAALQPYPRRHQALAQLRNLHEMDRSRSLLVTLEVTEDVHFRWQRSGVTLYESTLRAGEAEDGRALAAEAARGLRMPVDLSVRGEATYCLAFRNHTPGPPSSSLPVLSTLTQIADHVSEVVMPAFGIAL